MKNQMRFPRRRNQVSLLLIIFVLPCFLCVAQTPPPIYARLTMMKVRPGDEQEFEKYISDNVKPLHMLRRQKGEIALWILFKVHFKGDNDAYNYVGVSYCPTWAHTETKQSFAELIKEANPNADAEKVVAKLGELRTIVQQHIVYRTVAVEPTPPVPAKYVRLDFMKVRPGKTAAYLSVEKDDWMPVHQSLVKEGQSTGWALWQVIFPGGTELPYEYVTSSRFGSYSDVWSADFEKTFKKVSPAKNVSEVFAKTTESRDLVKSELWEVVDMLK